MSGKLRPYVFNAGILLFCAGIALRYIFPEAGGVLESLPHILSGFGAGIMGVGVIFLFRKRRIEADPEKAKQFEIDENDERNIRLKEKAGYAAWHITLFALAALSLTFLILDDRAACLLSLGVLLIHKISLVIFTYAYNKKM